MSRFGLIRPALWPVMLLALLASLAPAAPVRAQMDLSPLLSAELGRLKTSLSYQAETSGEQKVTSPSQPADLGYTQQDLRAFGPLWQGPGQELSLAGRARLLALDTTARFPSGQVMPSELWDLGLSALYRRRLSNGWIVGGQLGSGSASDKPFQGEKEMLLSATAFARIPNGERDAWLVFLNYDHKRDYSDYAPVIPGAAYWWTPSRQFQALIGLPLLSLRWRPAPDWDFSVSYAIPRTLRSRASYRLWGPLKVYGGYEMTSQSFFLSGRMHEEDRLYFYQRRALGGLEVSLGRGLALDLFGGWSFDRMFFEGQNYGDRGQQRVDVDDGAFLGGRLGYRF